LPATVADSLAIVVNLLDAGEVAARSGAAQQAVDQVSRWRPALHVQGEVHGALVGFDELQGFGCEAVHPLLQHGRRAGLDSVGADFDLHVGADYIDLHVEVLQQQDEAKVGVLQLELVAGVTANASGVPLVTGELYEARFFHQGEHIRTDAAPVELANGIDATAQQTHSGKVGHFQRAGIDEEPAMPVFKAAHWVEANLIYCLFHLNPR